MAHSENRLPSHSGVGFKPQHLQDILAEKQPVGFFEVHAENYMTDGGPAHKALSCLRQDYALSIHGVGLSIGGTHPLNQDHLQRLKTLVDRYQPHQFSEHLAWSTHLDDNGHAVFLNDLLPLPYTQDTLDHVVKHVNQVQDTLGRQMLLENPATYLLFETSTFSETDFLREVVSRTGCGLLLDINNVFVSAFNHHFSALEYLDQFPLQYVGEIHLAGHEAVENQTLLIDSHSRPVADPVWVLYEHVIDRTGPKPSLVEWDNDVPDWATLLCESQKAERILSKAFHRKAA